MVCSCPRTLEVTGQLEGKLGKAVVSSNLAMVGWRIYVQYSVCAILCMGNTLYTSIRALLCRLLCMNYSTHFYK